METHCAAAMLISCMAAVVPGACTRRTPPGLMFAGPRAWKVARMLVGLVVDVHPRTGCST